MAIIYDPKGFNPPTMAERIGTGLGTGLQALLQQKMQEMQARKGISALLGSTANQEQIKGLASLSPDLLKAILPQMYKSQAVKEAIKNYFGSESSELPVRETTKKGETIPTTSSIDKKAKDAFAKTYAATGNIDTALKAEENIRNRELQERKFAFQQEQALIKKETDLRKELASDRKKIEQAKDMDIRTEESIRSAQSGKMRAGTHQILMDKLGLGEAFRNPTTEAGQKNLEGFGLGVATAFGPGMGRIMKAEFDAFIRANANKFNTVEAISYIGQMNLLKNQLLYARDKAKREIIKQNNNRIPLDIDEQVEKKILPFQEEMQKKMRTLNQLLAADQLPSWNNLKNGNPALWKDASQVNFPTPRGKKVPMINRNGMWIVDFDRLGT